MSVGPLSATPLGRTFREWQGRVNRELAGGGDVVVWVAAGLADIAQSGVAPECAAAPADESSRRLWRLNVGLR
jgi:hypothetical protein